jgi:hypothetical protein
VRVYTDASREGLCGFCPDLYFAIALTPRWAALPMAVLEFVAFYGGILSLHSMDSSLVESVANNGKAQSELMQMVHIALLASPAFILLAPSALMTYITTEANAFSYAGTRQLLAAHFAALCEQAGVLARRIPPPSELPVLLDALWLLGVDVVARAPPPGSPPPPFAPPPIQPAAALPATHGTTH